MIKKITNKLENRIEEEVDTCLNANSIFSNKLSCFLTEKYKEIIEIINKFKK